ARAAVVPDPAARHAGAATRLRAGHALRLFESRLLHPRPRDRARLGPVVRSLRARAGARADRRRRPRARPYAGARRRRDDVCRLPRCAARDSGAGRAGWPRADALWRLLARSDGLAWRLDRHADGLSALPDRDRWPARPGPARARRDAPDAGPA